MDEQQRKQMYKETFNTVASGYDNDALRFFPKSAHRIAELLGVVGNEHLLDVATGTGHVALTIADYVPEGRVTGIDFSSAMLACAEEKRAAGGFRNVDFLEMDMQQLDFPDEHFDGAVCAYGIFFVDDMAGQIRHMAGKVKSKGAVVISCFHEENFQPLLDLLFNRLQAYGIELPPMTWKKVATEEKCEALFRQAGFADVQVKHENIGYYLDGTEQWWDLIWNAGYRGLVNQLSPDDLQRFRHEHLQEVDRLKDEHGIWLDVEVLFTKGVKR